MARSGIRVNARAVVVLAIIAATGLPTKASLADISDSPRFTVQSQSASVDALSDLRIDTQTNGTAIPFRSHKITVSSGWRFGVGSVRSSETYASCNNISSDTSTFPVDDMEAIGTAQLLVATDVTRNPPPPATPLNQKASDAPAAFTGNGATSGMQPASLWFLRWNDVTRIATICGRVTTTDARIDAAQRVIVFQVDLKLLVGGVWEADFDFDAVSGAPAGSRSLTDNPYYVSNHVSIPDVTLVISALTGGNYNLNPQTGKLCGRNTAADPGPDTDPGHLINDNQASGGCANACEPCRSAFSRTPTAPTTITFAGDFSTCPGGQPCSPAHREVTLPFRLDSNPYIYQAGQITSPTTAGLPADWALVRGSSQVTIGWKQPDVAGSAVVRGYALAIARLGDTANQHFEYIVTDASASDFDGRTPCGADGKAATCALPLNFPLSTIGSRTLDRNGVYDVALVTIYTDGARTDRRCDQPGNPQGIDCPPERPLIRVQPRKDLRNRDLANPGVWVRHLVLRSDSWPAAYGQVGEPEGGISLLLTDFAAKKGEFIDLTTTGLGPFEQGFVKSFVSSAERFTGPLNIFDSFDGVPIPRSDQRMVATSNTIIGDNAAGGIVSFGSPDIAGHQVDWRFDGVASTASAIGSFTVYDAKGAQVFSGVPGVEKGTLWTKVFRGTRLT